MQPDERTGYGGKRGSLALEVAAVLLVTAVAAALRFYQLDLAPPGLYHDEAIYGVLGLYVMHGNRSLFFGEREGLYMYLLADGVSLLGHDVTTLRIVSAIIGTATVPALYLLVRLMYGRHIALLAAAGLAASYWHVSLSRTVFRALTLPLFETVALLGLWAALRCRVPWGRLVLFLLAGGALGLVLYTYIAARMVPVLVVVFLATLLIWDRKPLAPAWANLTAYLGAAGLVFAPLGSFYLANPQNLLGRMGEVALSGGTGSAGLVDYLGNALRVAGMFFVAGDQNWRHNLAGRPVFEPLFAVAFLAGVALCLRGWRRAENRFLLLWLGLMLVPTIAAAEAPHYLRASGVLPALYVLSAIGLAAGFAWLAPRVRMSGRGAFAVFVGLALLIPTATTASTYFGTWLGRPETFAAFDGPLAAAGRHLASSQAWRDSAGGRQDFYLTSDFWQDRTTMLFYLWPWLAGDDRDDMGRTRLGSRWLDESRALPLRAGGASYLLADETSWAAAELCRIYGEGEVQVERPPLAPGGAYPFVVLTAPERAQFDREVTPLASFGDALTLEGFSLPPSVPAGESFDLITRWRIHDIPEAWRRGNGSVTTFMHVLDVDGSLLAGADGLGYHPLDWRSGESLVLRHAVRLPTGTAPGGYEIVVGLLDPDGKRVAETFGRQTDNTFPLPEGIQVVRGQDPRQELPPLAHTADFRVDGRLNLLGLEYDAESEVSPGEALRLTLYWQALTDVGTDYDIRLALVGEEGEEIAGTIGQPAFGRYPTGEWRAGEVVRDRRDLAVGARARDGTYTLTVAVTDRQTNASSGPVPIGQVRIRELSRVFAPPPMANALPVPANFGNLAELLGYDLDLAEARPGGSLRLTLYWRCREEGDTRYKVFAHLLDADGSLVAQSDAEPAAGTRPLTSWLSGEVVEDAHTIPLPVSLPAAEYRLAIGLYDATNGARLPLLDAEGRQIDSRLLPPLSLPK